MALKTQSWSPERGAVFHVLLDPEDGGVAWACFEACLEGGDVTPCEPRQVRPGVFTQAEVVGPEVLTGAAAQAAFEARVAACRAESEAQAAEG